MRTVRRKWDGHVQENKTELENMREKRERGRENKRATFHNVASAFLLN